MMIQSARLDPRARGSRFWVSRLSGCALGALKFSNPNFGGESQRPATRARDVRSNAEESAGTDRHHPGPTFRRAA